MKLLLTILLLTAISSSSYAQYSFIYISDSITLSEENAVVFDIDEIDETFVEIFKNNELTFNSAFLLNLDSLSQVIDDCNKATNKNMFEFQPTLKRELHQSRKFNEYAFQLYPVIDKKGGNAIYVDIPTKQTPLLQSKLTPQSCPSFLI